MKTLTRSFKALVLIAWAGLVYAWMSPAWATDKPPEKAPAPVTTATADADASADAAADAAAEAHGGAATASNDGVRVDVEAVRQAPSTFSAAATPTAPCYYVNGFSASVPGAGGGRFKSKRDDDCVVRERARLLIEAGYPELAARLLLGETIGPEELTPTVLVNPPAEPSCAEHATRALEACNSK